MCRHGEAVLGGQARSAIDPQEMHEKMLSAMREDRPVRAASRRHRGEFLRCQIRLIEPFCARQALTRLTREVKKEHILEIGAHVQALGKNGNCFEAIVLGERRRYYHVADVVTKSQVLLERSSVAPMPSDLAGCDLPAGSRCSEFSGPCRSARAQRRNPSQGLPSCGNELVGAQIPQPL